MKPAVISILIAFVLCSPYSQAQSTKFRLPLKGTPGQDFFICYYPDHDTSSGTEDPYCGKKTYDGHAGTDLIVRSFKTMDSGVYVFAAAGGRVLSVQDGNYDRHKNWAAGAKSNYVEILHPFGWLTYYYHLKKGSLLVKPGDTVKAGQPIAQLGSSGISSKPHLHFEVTKSGKIVDPFEGACKQEDLLWLEDTPYDTSVFVVESGFVPYLPNVDTLQERYLVRDTFNMKDDTIVCFWAEVHGLQPGDKTRFEWYAPSGDRQFVFKYTWPGKWWLDYSWCYKKIPKVKGKWLVKYYINDTLHVSRTFHLRKS